MKKTRFVSGVLILCAGTPLLACSGDKAVNIGNTNVIGSRLSDYAATWDGYAEAYTFMPDGSDRVRLTIAANGQGTFEVSKAALLPSPTDPNVGYPAGQPDPLTGPNEGLSGGVLYPVYAAQVQENRIQAGLKPNDYYGAWCALQTPYSVLNGYVNSGQPDAGDGGVVPNFVYKCMPGASGGIGRQGSDLQCSVTTFSTDGTSSDQPLDCGKFSLCSHGVCACTASSCATTSPVLPAGTLPSGYPVELDAALDSTGKTLTGTLALSTNLRVTVVLTKQ
jgi:hypothetical protein